MYNMHVLINNLEYNDISDLVIDYYVLVDRYHYLHKDRHAHTNIII